MIDKNTYYGNYVGIVVQNNDPEFAGKVKVFVPHLTPTVYSGWIDGNTSKKITKLLGNNVNGDLSEILGTLKTRLPWAECAAPLVGESSTGRFNNHFNAGSISESNFLTTTFSNGASSLSAEGSAPSSLYTSTSAGLLNDAFVTAADNINRPNPLAYNYRPNTYSNAARGAFAIPSVGSHVWVFFREGDPQFPVYFAASFGQSDWSGIYGKQAQEDYPGTYENIKTQEIDHNVSNYRNKYVVNQKGGSLEFINTDLNEKVKLSHYSGSFTEMTNEATIELATANKNSLILNDVYDTTRGFKNEFTGKNLDEIVKRDKYKKVGSLNDIKFKEWNKIVAPIQEFKQLFEIKRTGNNNVKNANNVTILKRNSVLQEQDGTFRCNPVTDGTFTYKALGGLVNSSPGCLGGGVYSGTVTSPGDNGPGTLAGTDSTINTGRFPSPGGAESTASPSTSGGTWTVDTRKDTLQTLIESKLPELTKIEQDLGIGGSEIIQITKNKVETIGMMMNSFGNYRLDPIGKSTASGVKVGGNATYLNREASPLLEYVHVQDLPGGTSTLNVSNRYNVVVGAGGLNLKSYGPTNITGSITNVTGEQVNIGSANEINLDAHTINISAEILALRNKRQHQVLIDSSLGVNKNVIIGGGMHVEGELHLQHVTAPREYQLTEPVVLYGELVASCTIGTDADGSSVAAVATANSVKIYSHSHAFANLPLTLKDTNTQVRNASRAAFSCNCATGEMTTDRVVATCRVNERK